MNKNNDNERPSAPNYEALYEEAVATARKMFEKEEKLEAKCRALEVENVKYKTIIKTLEFLLGRELDA